MEKRTIRISPAGYSLLRERLLLAENHGLGPNEAAGYAMLSVGISPKANVETILEVDYNLDGPVWPFMAWPGGWDRYDRATWR